MNKCKCKWKNPIITYMKNVETLDTTMGHHCAAASITTKKRNLKVDLGKCVQMYRAPKSAPASTHPWTLLWKPWLYKASLANLIYNLNWKTSASHKNGQLFLNIVHLPWPHCIYAHLGNLHFLNIAAVCPRPPQLNKTTSLELIFYVYLFIYLLSSPKNWDNVQ